jgi:hypothetical protein
MAAPGLVGRLRASSLTADTTPGETSEQQQQQQQHESIPSVEVVMDGSTVSASAADDTVDSDAAAAPTSTSESDRLQRHETAQNLRNLEEERENRRRRTSTCTLIATFFLFRLWVEALASSDSSLLLVALLLTSWAFRWFHANRETEDEIDRAILEYIQRADEEEGGEILSPSAMARASAIETGDLRLMSFQAQLALAVLESQRQMMNGGYGAEDNYGAAAQGLDEEAKARWQRFSYQAETSSRAEHSEEKERNQGSTDGAKRKKRFGLPLRRGGYGSVPSLEQPAEGEGADALPLTSPETIDGGETAKDNHGSDPVCSICLCEYQQDEILAEVGCGHKYHDSCISAWAECHYRCPLCNCDMRGETIV